MEDPSGSSETAGASPPPAAPALARQPSPRSTASSADFCVAGPSAAPGPFDDMDTDDAWLDGLSLELPALGSAALPAPAAPSGAANLGRLSSGTCFLIPANPGACAAPPCGAHTQLPPVLADAGMFGHRLALPGGCAAPAAAAPCGPALAGLAHPLGLPVLQPWPGTAAAHPQLMHPERGAQAALLLPGQGQLPGLAAWGSALPSQRQLPGMATWGPVLGGPAPALAPLLTGRPLGQAAHGAGSPPALLMPVGAPATMLATPMVQPVQTGATGAPPRGTGGPARRRRAASRQPSASPSPAAKHARGGGDAWRRSPRGSGRGRDAAQGAGRGEGSGVGAAAPAATAAPAAASSGGGGGGGGSSRDEPTRPTRFRGVSWRKSQGRYESVAFVETRRYRLGNYRWQEPAARAYDLLSCWRGLHDEGFQPKLNYPASDYRRDLLLSVGLEELAAAVKAKARVLMEAGRKRGASGSAVPPPLPPNLEAVVAVMADAAAAAAGDAAPAERPSLSKKAKAAGDEGQNKTSKYLGVCFSKGITKARKRWYLGLYDKEEDAAAAYDQAALCAQGALAQTNFPRSRYDAAALAGQDISTLAPRLAAAAGQLDATLGARKAEGGAEPATPNKRQQYSGVTAAGEGQWHAHALGEDRQRLSLGAFGSEHEAAAAHDLAVLHLHTHSDSKHHRPVLNLPGADYGPARAHLAACGEDWQAVAAAICEEAVKV